MTVALAENHIKPSNLPQYCSACFGQDSTLRHIDFGAACDRGFYGNDPATHITMDDLVLCENCLRSGANLLGMVDEDQQKISMLEARLDLRERELKQARSYSETMEDALSKRPEKIQIDHRKKPRRVRGQED